MNDELDLIEQDEDEGCEDCGRTLCVCDDPERDSWSNELHENMEFEQADEWFGGYGDE